ncbi:MAG: plastocyanin/azurin family copper-binding protein [Chloroflexota bacterium]
MTQRFSASHAAAGLAAAVFLLAGCSASPAGRTLTPASEVEVILTDAMRMEPAELTVGIGAPVTFRITNMGKVEHEFYIGSEAEQTAHDAEMLAGPMHEHLNGVGLAPGETRTLTYTFERAGPVLAGCHVPGHYAAGMVARILVTA